MKPGGQISTNGRECKVCQNYLFETLAGHNVSKENGKVTLESRFATVPNYFCAKEKTPKEALNSLVEGKPLVEKQVKENPHSRFIRWLPRLWYEVKQGENTGSGHSLEEANRKLLPPVIEIAAPLNRFERR